MLSILRDMKDWTDKIHCGDALEILKQMPDGIVNCCVTSPPYWQLRDYNVKGQLGLEKTPEEYVQNLVEVFREVKRVLRDDGTVWLNMGDSYTNNSIPAGKDPTIEKRNIGKTKYTPTIIKGLKPKNLIGMPWRVAFALQADGWYLRQDIIWHKKNPMPEAVKDRCTKAHEYIFLLSKSAKYYYDQDAIKEPASNNTHARVARAQKGQKSNPTDKISGIRPRTPKAQAVPSGWDTGDGNHDKLIGRYPKIKSNPSFEAALCNMVDNRNKRSVWTVGTKAFPEAHFATFPPKLIEDCVKAGCPVGGIVLDPFAGSGTTKIVTRKQDKYCIAIELNEEYIKMAERRIYNELGMYL